MKKDFTREEAKDFMDVMRKENETVRIVDPVTQRVIRTEGLEDGGPTCCHFWGHDERCENCTSFRALKNKGLSYKLEAVGGRTFWVFSRFIRVDGHPYVMEMINDVTRQLLSMNGADEHMDGLIEMRNHSRVSDALTGVYNRLFWEEHVIPSLEDLQRNGTVVCLAILDIDEFKQVNDTYGHTAGDALLKDVASFWQQQFDCRLRGQERMIVRFGGDELLILSYGLPLEEFRTRIAQCYSQMRKVCYYQEDLQIPFSLSFGVASSSELTEDWDWDALLAQADQRMYSSKRGRAGAGLENVI